MWRKWYVGMAKQYVAAVAWRNGMALVWRQQRRGMALSAFRHGVITRRGGDMAIIK